jgi:hypothetical protein
MAQAAFARLKAICRRMLITRTPYTSFFLNKNEHVESVLAKVGTRPSVPYFMAHENIDTVSASLFPAVTRERC